MSIEETRAFWDERAAAFDDEPDHGLGDPATRRAWATLLDDSLDQVSGPVIDLGCGTGSLSLLLAERGHEVVGIDASPKMINKATKKAQLAGLDIEFAVGDIAKAPVRQTPVSAVICRHVLWAVSDPSTVVARWSAALTGDGSFVAVEGVWNGAGIPAEQAVSILEHHFHGVELTDLADRADLWGKEVSDVRYVAVGRRPRR